MVRPGSQDCQLVSWQRAAETTLVRVGDPILMYKSGAKAKPKLHVATVIDNGCPKSPVNAVHDYSSQHKLLEAFQALKWATSPKIVGSTRGYPTQISKPIDEMDSTLVWLGGDDPRKLVTTYQRLDLAKK